MRRLFAAVLVLALSFAPVAGAVRPLVPAPCSAQCGADSASDVAIAGRRSGSTSALGAVLAGASTAVTSRVTLARSDGATANRIRAARRAPRAVWSARFHCKRPAPERDTTEPPFVL